jgi:hypothetical protein
MRRSAYRRGRAPWIMCRIAGSSGSSAETATLRIRYNLVSLESISGVTMAAIMGAITGAIIGAISDAIATCTTAAQWCWSASAHTRRVRSRAPRVFRTK